MTYSAERVAESWEEPLSDLDTMWIFHHSRSYVMLSHEIYTVYNVIL